MHGIEGVSELARPPIAPRSASTEAITEYVVPPLRGSTSYPARFTDRAKAKALAQRTGRQIVEEEVPIMKRIRWK